MFIPMLFTIGLLLCIAVAHKQRCPLLVRAAWVMAANFLFGILSTVATGRAAPVEWLLFIDVASAIVMLWHPGARTQAILGMVYAAQIVMHAVHWAAGFPGGAWFYILMLNVGGGLQIAFLLHGAVNGDGQRKMAGIGGSGGGALLDMPARANRVSARAS